jgi:ABC-type multidrug transport system ATPase subunit
MALPRWMSVEGAIRMNAGLFPNWDRALAARLLDEFRLQRQGRFGVLSRGQKRKAMLLLALCQRADLLIFDEPTSGLDVESRRRFLDCLLDVALDGNRSVLLSSHILSDIERIADRIVILQNGRLLIEGELEDLKGETRRLDVPQPVPRCVLDEHFRVHSCDKTANGETVATVLNFAEETFNRFITALPPDQRQAVQVNGFNLEELYLTLTGSGFRTRAAGPHVSLAGKQVSNRK